MKLSKINPNYIFAGVILLVGIVYGIYNYTQTGSFFPFKQPIQQEEVIEEDTTPAVEEEKTEPTTPTQVHITCATNDWDCFAKAAKDKNTATMISYMKNFPELFSGYMLDITTEFKIINIASNGDVTLSEKKTKVIVAPIEYTDEQLEKIKESWGIDEEITPEQIESGRQERDAYWQKQIGLTRISVFTLESFLVFIDQWEAQNWSWSSGNELGQAYKVVRDDFADQREPIDWVEWSKKFD